VKLSITEHWLEVNRIAYYMRRILLMHIIFIGPVIVDDVILEFQLTINDNRLKNTVLLIDLPVISTKNGPFRLVNVDSMY